MMCSVCHQGETHPGTNTVTPERGALTVVAKDVPALVCADRGEEHLDPFTTEQAPRLAEKAAASGVQVDIRAFNAA